MARNIMFVTKGNGDYYQGFSYVVALSKALGTGIFVLMMYDMPPDISFGNDVMSDMSGGTIVTKETSLQFFRSIRDDAREKTNFLIDQYCMNNVPRRIGCKAGSGSLILNIKESVENDPDIDTVLLSPSVCNKRFIDIKKHIKNISRRVITMSKLPNTDI